MADAIQQMLAFPPEKKKKELSAKEYDKDVRLYIKNLDSLSPNQWIKTVDKKNILELLDPSVNSIPYLTSLNAQFEENPNGDKSLEELLNCAQDFAASFDPVQIRYVGKRWFKLFEHIHTVFENSNDLDVAYLSILPKLLLRLDPSAGTFTHAHLRIVRMALRKHVPSLALPVIEKDIYAFPHKVIRNVTDELLGEEHELSNAYITEDSDFSFRIKPEYVLEYYLLGAHIYIGRRDFHRARLFLEYVILAPTQQHCVSALQVEAYKKWLLIGLLEKGEPHPVPRTLDQSVLKSIRNVAKPYDALADDFSKRDHKKYLAEAEAGQTMWDEDGNSRLVKEAASALIRYRVLDLQKTFAALSTARVARAIDLSEDDALELLQQMIQHGYLKADISSTDGVLRFHETSTDPTLPSGDLEAQTRRITALVASIKDTDRRLQLTKEYVEYAKRMKRTNDASGDVADMMDLTWDTPAANDDGDEDLMIGNL